MLSFEYPFAFLLLLVYLVCAKFCKAKNPSFYFSNIDMLEKAAKKANVALNLVKFIIAFLLITALASPVKKDEISFVDDKGYEIALMLDVSGSMERGDKFSAVKNIVKDFIAKRTHDKIGLSVFADFAYVAIPLTYDKNSIKRLLDRVDVGIAGTQKTALYEALFLTANLFKDSTAKDKIIILPTDGMDNAGSIPLDVAIKTAQKYGIKVYTIGVGVPGDFNPAVLAKIAKDTGGEYFSSNSFKGLEEIYSKIDKLEKSDIRADKYIKKTYYFHYFALFAGVFMVVYFFMINRKRYV
ncbi:vWA domain-containing protein [Campylobacter geochelonis]|uniref:Mg-chelatase subunit ChlD n=1 Tax=Campylobacter geochelonis TaxID=1780362 RepID=A0A128ERH8_9BACT|nr:VWA domain-containing protein [Campylobacter geochelonis]QKF70939.1 von Willebrand factor type A (vWA) domain-containing protein (BatA domain), putative oxygen tolerance protein BatA [Campylobacter geochelonis]CZE46999.1 Mg-chelatase subunit ChlD [Campylobacter geochelonis]CZE51214.1 Mg-chelatase subunit ChlD [Campylobacter geochelonis]